MKPGTYAKLLTALTGAAFTILSQVYGGGSASQNQWELIVTTLATALGVYAVPNTPKAPKS